MKLARRLGEIGRGDSLDPLGLSGDDLAAIGASSASTPSAECVLSMPITSISRSYVKPS